MKKIVLQNFLKMTPEAPQYSEANQHYLLSGVNPTYYLDTPDTSTFDGIQEEQIAPLIASQKWNLLNNTTSGSAYNDITESSESTYDFYFIRADSRVFAYDLFFGTKTDCGYPNLVAENTSLQKIKCFANNLLVVTKTSTSPNIWRTALPASGSSTWTPFGSISNDGDEHFLEPFLEYCMITDNKRQVKKIDTSFNVTSGIDLGIGWTINGMRNYNDKYLAIAGSTGSFNNNFLFLWNGRSDTYNYSIKMAGRFLDMKVVDGTLYVAIWVSGTGNQSGTGKTVLYCLSGTSLKEVTLPFISTIKYGFKQGIFSMNNNVGINLNNSNSLMIYGKTPTGTAKFVQNDNLSFTKISDTYSGSIVGIVVTGGNYFLYYLPTVNINSRYNTITYKSQWIPVKNLSGIDIEYDTPPQSGTDAINVTIYGRGEDIISGNSTTVLDSITPTNYLNTTRTRLDTKNFAGDKVKILLTTVNSGAWRPIIRKITLITE